MTGYSEIARIAHLMRRAGFGASREDLEHYSDMGYEATVEELLNPELQPDYEDDLAYRYVPYYRMGTGIPSYQCYWMYRMISTRRPLEEKMTLFWHHVFATGWTKSEHTPSMVNHIEMLRKNGLANFRTLLLELSKAPAMSFWLDNSENHGDAPTENYGRELLELFSIGVGMDNEFNYTEDDVKACARAFTGWTLAPTIPVFPYGRTPFEFRFDPADHDYGEKTFLGETGNWDGGDIVDIICKQPATARFVARKLYDFFVADEPPVPAWRLSEPRDMAAIKQLETAYFDSGYEITAMLTVLFNSDFFKDEAVRFAKVKSPADVVIGTMRMVGDHLEPKPGLFFVAMEPKYMGFDLMNPPTVEGWHMGREWINSGSLIDRINFASSMLGDTELPGVKNIINRLMNLGDVPSPEQFLDGCLDLVGPMELAQETRDQLTDHLNAGGALKHSTDSEKGDFSRRAGETLQMIATTSEFQFG